MRLTCQKETAMKTQKYSFRKDLLETLARRMVYGFKMTQTDLTTARVAKEMQHLLNEDGPMETLFVNTRVVRNAGHFHNRLNKINWNKLVRDVRAEAQASAATTIDHVKLVESENHAVRIIEAMRANAIELFQSGGKFYECCQWGDNIFSVSFNLMCEFVKQHEAKFKAFVKK